MQEKPEPVVWQLTDIKTQKKVNVYKPKIIVGRSKEADLICKFISASRTHAAFTLDGGQLRVADLNSSNGTLVNKQRIPPEVPYVLNDGDEVALGDIESVKEEYQCFKVGKMTSVEIITLEISDDEDEHLNDTLVNKKTTPPEISHSLNNEDKVGNVISTDVIILESSDDEDAVEKEESVPRPVLNAKSWNEQVIKQEVQLYRPLSSDNKADTEDSKISKNSTCPPFCIYENKVIKQEVSQNKPLSSDRKTDAENGMFGITSACTLLYTSSSGNKAPTENSKLSTISTSPLSCTYANKEVTKQTVEQNKPLSSGSKVDKENNLQNDQFPKKMDVDEEPKASSFDDLGSHQLATKPKTEPLASLDEEIIVIIDDDDDDGVMMSQVLAINGDSAVDERPAVTDDIFYKIKKEVEEFDKVECREWEYPCAIDSDDENLSEIFAEELNEDNTNQQNNPLPPSPRAVQNENANASHSSELNKQSSPASSSPRTSPSAAPIENGDLSPEVFYKRPLSTLLIEAQPLKKHNSRKRKSDVKKKEDSTKKKKRNSSAEKHSGHFPQDHSKRKKETEKNVDDKRGRKEEKKKISEIRKEKLKELATKSTESKSDENKSRVNKPKVKVSEGRGNFLLNDVDSAPSTSKAKDSLPKKSSRHKTNAVRTPSDQTKAVIRPELTNKNVRLDTVHKAKETSLCSTKNQNVRVNTNKANEIMSRNTKKVTVDTTDEIKEVLSWNTNWLARSEYLTLNPVVRLKNLKPLEKSYSRYHDYFEMNRSLLMVELWAHVQKEFEVNRSNCVFPMFVEECEHDSKSDISKLTCTTYLTKIQAESLTSVRESDLLVIDLRLLQNDRVLIKPSFGFIQDCTKCILRNHHYINATLAGRLDSMPHTKITLRVLTNRRPEEIKMSSIVNFKIVTSLVSHLRLFKSLKYLEHSPLINIILKPSAKDFTLPNITQDTLVSKDNLNRIQFPAAMEAVYVCSRPEPGLYLIQGPPGTGKTNVIKNIILQLLYGKNKIQNGCILLVAPSNAAIDQLVLKLVLEAKPKLSADQKKDMKLVRVGPESSIHTKVKSYSLEDLSKKYFNRTLLLTNAEAAERNKELLREMKNVEIEIEALKARKKDVTHLRTKWEHLKNRSENFAKDILKERYNQLFSQNCDFVLCHANIICTTLSSCMSRRIEENVLSGKLNFACCIVDEATQSTEQESLIPLRLGVKRMVLVGDPQQLPATVMSSDAKMLGYGCSLFQRILRNFSNSKSKPLKILNKQYRMHPEIFTYPNQQYYGGRLNSTFTYNKPLQPLKPFLMFSLNVPYNHRKQEMYKNADEACFIHKLIEALLDIIPHDLNVSIGIITPYQNQRAVIHSMIKSLKCRRSIYIECNTVDSFQGRETDITILSCVREDANSFVNDAHRLNVALTRAKYALYVVGVKSLFDNCAELVRLRQNAEGRGLLRDGTHLKCNDLKRMVWR